MKLLPVNIFRLELITKKKYQEYANVLLANAQQEN